jgi:biopolymer transport protein ExbD
MAKRKKKGIDDKIEDLNLVPIMNLVVCLIPIVLFGMSLVKIGVINVNTPKFGMGQSAPAEDDKKPLGLTIAIGKDGFILKATGANLNDILGIPAEQPANPEDAAVNSGVKIAKAKELYDYLDLYAKLKTIKKQFPEESIVNLTAEADTHFKHVITTMDAIRYDLKDARYDNIKSFADASRVYERKVVDGKDVEVAKLLWPDVVFAVAN